MHVFLRDGVRYHLPALILAALAVGCQSVPEGGTPVGQTRAATDTAAGVAGAATLAAPASGAASSGPTVPASGTMPIVGATAAVASQPPGAAASATAPTGAGDYIGLSAQGGVIGDTYNLTDLRVGEHEGFTRIVWELDQTGGSPRFEAVERSNVSEPISGMSLAGAARIEVTLHDTQALQMAGRVAVDTPASGVVRGVQIVPNVDDSLLTFAVVLDRPARFEIVALEVEGTPTRIVLDVYDN